MLSCDLCNHLFKIGTFIFSIFFLRVRNQRSGAITGLSSSRLGLSSLVGIAVFMSCIARLQQENNLLGWKGHYEGNYGGQEMDCKVSCIILRYL